MAMILGLTVASCGSEKQATSPASTSATQNQPKQEEVIVEIPCIDASYDDQDYYRELGIGTALNPQMARKAAVKAAQSMIREKLNGITKGLSTDYSRNVSGNSSTDKMQEIVESEINNVINKMLNDAEKTCETLTKLDDGNYRAYYAIQISKKDIVNKAIDSLSKNEDIELMFNRDQFRKYAEEYLNKNK